MWETIVQFVGKLKFYVIVMPDETGIKIRRGRIVDELSPGFYWIVPVLDEVILVTVTEQTIDTPNQPIMTHDGKSLCVSASISYKIVDAAAAKYRVLDFDRSLAQTAMTILCQAVNCRDLSECWSNAEMESDILDLLQQEAQHWGLQVTSFKITAKTPAKVLALMKVD